MEFMFLKEQSRHAVEKIGPDVWEGENDADRGIGGIKVRGLKVFREGPERRGYDRKRVKTGKRSHYITWNQ